jgi:hypothetical protein
MRSVELSEARLERSAHVLQHLDGPVLVLKRWQDAVAGVEQFKQLVALGIPGQFHCVVLSLRRPEHLLLLTLSLRQWQWLLQRYEGDTALVFGRRFAPDTDAFCRVSRSLDVSKRHVPLLARLAQTQTRHVFPDRAV